MAEHDTTPGAAPVTDNRPVPQGVLPRRFQTWLLAGLGLGIVLIIMLAGEPHPPSAPPVQPRSDQAPPSADRLRDYQDRLRAMEARASVEATSGQAVPPEASYHEPSAPPPEDPLVTERRRREYESLFASNIVLSRRPEHQRPDTGRVGAAAGGGDRAAGGPSLDEVAEAVVRASSRPAPSTSSSPAADDSASDRDRSTAPADRRDRSKPESTGPIDVVGPTHRLLEGTVIDTVLTNRLDGGAAGPVNCLVTNAVHSHSGQHIVIPAGARVLGETRPVQSLGETRLAVAFHRLVMPDGRTYRLDRFPGMNQRGDAGLRDQVNHHYWSTFGAAGAVGLITGLAQWLGTAGVNGGDGDRTVIIGSGAADATAQASMQVMHQFLNRLPTVTIREGHRVKVYLTSDLDLPAYDGLGSGFRW